MSTREATAPARDLPAWVAWSAVAVTAAVTTVVVWHSSGIAFANDEVATMMKALAMARPSVELALGGNTYMPGTAMLLAPIWWLTDDPGLAYRIATIALAVPAVGLVWPLARVARHFHVAPHTSVVLGSVVAVAPEHALLANYVWSEQVLAFALACAAWAGLAVFRTTTTWRLTVFAAVSASLYLIHGRMVLVAAVFGLAVVALAWRERRSWAGVSRMAAAPVAAYGTIVLGAQWLHVTLTDRLYQTPLLVIAPPDRTQKTLDALANQDPEVLASVAAGQAWYVGAGWAGIAVLGAILVAGAARRGSLAWPARWFAAATVGQLLFVTLVLAGEAAGKNRIDLFVYGRYFAPMAVVLSLLGLVALSRGLSRRAAVIAAAYVVVTGVALVTLTVPSLPVGGSWYHGHLPAVSFLLNSDLQGTDTRDDWRWIAGLLGLVAITVVALARYRLGAVLALAGFFVAVTVGTDVGPMRADERASRRPAIEVVLIDQAVPRDVPLALDRRLWHVVLTENRYLYWAHPREVISYDPGTTARPSEVVLSSWSWEEAREGGALPMNGTSVGNTVVWVFPGPLQDALVADGRLALPVDDEAAEQQSADAP